MAKDTTRPARLRHAQDARAATQTTVDRLRVKLDALQEDWVNVALELAKAEEQLEALQGEERRLLAERPALAKLALVGAALLLCTLAAPSCAHAEQRPIVVPEPFGGAVASVIERVDGMRPYGVTFPGLAPVYFTPNPDPCLVAHEDVHRAQQAMMGPRRWFEEYTAELAACEGSVPLEARRAQLPACLRSIQLEAAAYSVQHDCERRTGT